VEALTPVESLEKRRSGPASRAELVSGLFSAHHRRLVGLAALLVDDRETAEDVVQEAFAGVYRRWRLLRDPEAALAYLNRAVVNGARDQLRRRRTVRARLAVVSGGVEALASAEHSAVERDEFRRLWDAVTRLPLRQRQVLVLRFYLDQSEAEIASTLGISTGSVKTHASRGLTALARSWEGQS
jgi:RNA polymerase sigma-70 factor (sigma-E family)